MNKVAFIALAGLVALAVTAFGPRSWNQPVAVEQASTVSPFALTISAGPIAVAPNAETF